MTRHIRVLICIMGILMPGLCRAQYYDWGQEPASVRFNQIKTDEVRYIFPDYYGQKAVRLMNYMDTIRPHIGFGFTHGPMRKIPLILHTQNFQSNGIVILAPRRMEFIVTPGNPGPAFPWLKQLAVHEYRHAVQYNNLNRGFIRGLSYVLGEQGSLVGLAFLPVWLLEGDAVMAETQMSTFGRGLQPSFTIEYRALAGEGIKYSIDKYFSGSFKHFLPDHYQLGYQIASYSYDKYGENIWDKVAWFGSKYPYLFCTTYISLKKYYGTSVNDLFKETFAELHDFWGSLPEIEDSAGIIPTPITSYTTYITPLYLDENTVVAIKSDLDQTGRIVRVDVATGCETVLCSTGAVNNGLTLSQGRLYWTEYRQSTFWEQRVNSQLCWYDLATGKKGIVKTERRFLFPAAGPEGTIAGVEYRPDGKYHIKCGDWSLAVPDTVTVHGLTYDEVSRELYFIGLSDDGMWIGSAAPGSEGFRVVNTPGFTSIANLRSAGGRLYFNSIYSGRDEAHMYDIASGREYRLTESRYGSFSPLGDPSGENTVMTTYTADGYLLAQQGPGGQKMEEVPYRRIPYNVVNPSRLKWDVPNMDEINVTDTTFRPVSRYRKAKHLFNFHSWAPVYFDPYEMINETSTDINLGVTVLSQNNLNSTLTQLGYAWADGHNHIRGRFHYYGWAPKFEIQAEWSDKRQLVYRPSEDSEGNPVEAPAHRRSYFDVTATAYLPLLLSSGYHIRRLTPRVEYEFNNARLYDHDKETFYRGLHKTQFSVMYSDNVRMSYRDFLPRWGYAARVSHTVNPFRTDFGKIWTAYGRIYAPGILPHHSLMLRGALQYQKQGIYNFRQKTLYPRGADYNFVPHRYASASVDYQFPVWYPDIGINSIVYFKRIRLNLLGDFARYETFTGRRGNVYTYGGEITIDMAPLRIPASNTASLTVSVYKPSDRSGVKVGLGVSLPL